MRAATYHRVSTRDQNPAGARVELRRRALAEGFDLSEEFEIEETGSGVRKNRPGMLRLLDLVERKKVEAVYVWKLDRLGRSPVDIETNVERMLDAGVRVVVTTQGLDMKPGEPDPKTGKRSCTDPVTNLQRRMLSAFSEFERELIIERTMMGLENVLEKLATSGTYKSRKTGRLITRLGRPGADVPLSHVERALQLYDAGQSWAKVSRQMAGEGMKQPKREVAGDWRPARPWATGTLRDACRRAVEKGDAKSVRLTPRKSRGEDAAEDASE